MSLNAGGLFLVATALRPSRASWWGELIDVGMILIGSSMIDFGWRHACP